MSAIALAFDDVAEIVSVLSDAFHDYPVMRHILGPDAPELGAPYDVRLHRLVQLFVSNRAYRNEPMFGVRDEAGALVGAAVMSLPVAKDPPPVFIARREFIWAELGVAARARYDAYAAAANFFATAPPHHHLNMIGVRQSHQGLGLGRVLLAAVHTLAGADEGSAGVSLTTERAENVAVYEHFGYVVQGHTRVAAGLETWGMFRAARPLEEARSRDP
jgi:GNAT superfamily N-acetyltransferase